MLDYFRSSSSSSPEAAIAAMANEESASIVTEKKEKIDRLTHLRHQSLLSYHTPDETRDDNTPHHSTNEGREGGSSTPEGYETTDCGGRHGVSVTIVDGGGEVMNTGNASAKMRLKNKLAKFTNVITKKGRNSNNGKNKGGGGGGGSQAPTLYSHSVPQDLQFMVSINKAMRDYGSTVSNILYFSFSFISSYITYLSIIFAPRRRLLLVPKADSKRTSARLAKRIDIRPQKIFSTG